MLTFQHVTATRNDLGQLASMQNKLVRIAIERLRLSLEELAGDLPPEAMGVYAAAIAEDAAAPRVFLPTRPSILRSGEALRLFIVTEGVGNDPALVLLTRPAGDRAWSSTPVRHEGRNVSSATLGPVGTAAGAIEYRVEALGPSGAVSDPPGNGFHTATVLS